MATKKASRVRPASKTVQVVGKTETFKPTRLDQITGDMASPYKTNDLQVYIQSLGNLNKTDLQRHSQLRGLVPIENREELTRRLVKGFKHYHAGLAGRPDNMVTSRELSSPSSEVQSIMSEGR
jgi:hypothetical protein